MTIVTFSSRQMRASSSCMVIFVMASSAPSGSSSSRISGCTVRARAMPTRCAMPPESWLGIGVGELAEADERDVALRPSPRPRPRSRRAPRARRRRCRAPSATAAAAAPGRSPRARRRRRAPARRRSGRRRRRAPRARPGPAAAWSCPIRWRRRSTRHSPDRISRLRPLQDASRRPLMCEGFGEVTDRDLTARDGCSRVPPASVRLRRRVEQQVRRLVAGPPEACPRARAPRSRSRGRARPAGAPSRTPKPRKYWAISGFSPRSSRMPGEDLARLLGVLARPVGGAGGLRRRRCAPPRDGRR